MLLKKLLPIFVASVFMGCGEYQYRPAHVLPDNLQSLAIIPFKNNTVYYGLEDLLVRELTDEFTRTGRLLVKDKKEADALLTGEIVRYILEPLSYDAHDKVEEYKLWIVVNIKLVEKATGEILYYEENIKTYVRYFVTPRAGEVVETEEEAVLRAVRDITQEIVQLILRFEY